MGWRRNAAGSSASWKARVLAKVGMGLVGGCVGLMLYHGLGKGGASVQDMVVEGFEARALEDTECADSLLPIRNGTFQTNGIKFCEDEKPYLSFISILIMFYCFWGLAIVVDEGFVTVLDFIVQDLAISEDVAGATFMAAGGSAPEFFTNLFSTFENTGTGFGTIVGSAVFNILFVISMSAFFSRPRAEVVRRRELRAQGKICNDPWVFEPLPLSWWPLLRDATGYILGLIVLAIFYYCFVPNAATCSNDGSILWYESMTLFLMYVFYCSFMAFQTPVRTFVENHLTFLVPLDQRTPVPSAGGKVGDQAIVASTTQNTTATTDVEDQSQTSSEISTKVQRLVREASVSFNPSDVQGKRASFNVHSRRGMLVNGDYDQSSIERSGSIERTGSIERRTSLGRTASKLFALNEEDEEGANVDIVVPRMRPTDWKGDPERQDDFAYRFRTFCLFVLVIPILVGRFVIYFNYDNLTNIKNRTVARICAAYAFFMSLVVIAVLTFFMVFAAESFAASFGIPDVVVGFTLLAAGTSTPDLLSSVFVAQMGYGDMAVSSSIGSNIFDILVGLPIPWLLKSIVSGEAVPVPAGSVGVSLAVIIMMMVSLVGIIIWQKWKLTKAAAWAMLAFYFVFLISMIIVEYQTNPDLN